MSYIKENLSKNEKITKEVELSKMGLIIPSVWLLVSIFVPYLIFIPAYMFLRFFKIEQAVTNKKVMKKSGIISRNINEIRLSKAETVEFKQTIFGRIFNYGNVVVTGTGNSKLVFEFVSNPRVVKNEIDNLLDD